MTRYIGTIIDGNCINWYDDPLEFAFIPATADRIVYVEKES